MQTFRKHKLRMCVCVCVCVREREREGGKDKAEEPWQRDQGRL